MSDELIVVVNSGPESEQLCGVANPPPGQEAALEEPQRLCATPAGAGRRGEAGVSARRLLVRGTEPRMKEGLLVPKSLIGQDERTRILDTADAPWRMICSLQIRGGGRKFIGTGWFAGPRTVITAGHCVFDSGMGGWADEIAVIPGRDGELSPFGRLRSHRFATTNRWMTHHDPDYDYAAIHLGAGAEAVTAEIGWFSTAVLNDAALRSQRVNVSGYPGDKGEGERWGGEQWFHAKQIVYTERRRIYYDVDTYGGQSGSPVWIETDEGPMVVGIHAYGVGGSSSLGLQANSAPRINNDVFVLLRSWIEES